MNLTRARRIAQDALRGYIHPETPTSLRLVSIRLRVCYKQYPLARDVDLADQLDKHMQETHHAY